jgi:hypothetical protein
MPSSIIHQCYMAILWQNCIFGVRVKSNLLLISLRDIMMRDIAAESTADNLVEDLICNEDNESSREDNPAQGEKDKGKHVEELITVGIRLREAELDLQSVGSDFYF